MNNTSSKLMLGFLTSCQVVSTWQCVPLLACALYLFLIGCHLSPLLFLQFLSDALAHTLQLRTQVADLLLLPSLCACCYLCTWLQAAHLLVLFLGNNEASSHSVHSNVQSLSPLKPPVTQSTQTSSHSVHSKWKPLALMKTTLPMRNHRCARPLFSFFIKSSLYK